jgi:predicted DNA-binding protein (MmcQ/YjbR family)
MKVAPSAGVLKKLRAICLSLPNTKETLSWGSPHFRVGEKIFCGIGDEKGVLAIGFKLEMDHADAVIQDPRFWRAPFVGRYGWVSMAVTPRMNWRQVKAFVEESYRLIAPREKTRTAPKTQRAANRRALERA